MVDVSHAQFEEHIAVVNQTLKDLEVMNKPVIMVFNKIDALSDEQKAVNVETTWMHKANNPAIFISAQNKTNTAELLEMIGERLPEVRYY